MNNIIIIILLCLLNNSAFAENIENKNLKRFILKNNMEVILIEDHKVPAISHMVWYRVGSNDDPSGKSGLAHFVEHMMFKSTKNLKNGEFHKIISENGGNLNAFTTINMTCYYENITKDKLPLVMQLEADRMQNLSIDFDEVKKEREVVMNERHLRYDNIPESLLTEQMHASLYINHPAHKPVIGWSNEIENLQKEDIEKFYNKYYRPDNAILIVAGDIDIMEVEMLAEKYYGSIDMPKDKLERKQIEESEQSSIRSIIMCNDKASSNLYSKIYQIPILNRDELWKMYGVSLINQIIGSDKFSILYKSLVIDKKISNSTYSEYYYHTITSPGVFGITIDVNDQTDLNIIDQELNKIINHLVRFGISEKILQNAKTTLVNNHIYSKESYKNLGLIYGRLAIDSINFEYFDNFYENINKIDLNQINSLIKEIFNNNRSVKGQLYNKESFCNELHN